MATLSEVAWLLVCVCAGVTAGHVTTTPTPSDGKPALEKVDRNEELLKSPQQTKQCPCFAGYGSGKDGLNLKNKMSVLETKLEAMQTMQEAALTKLGATETNLEATQRNLEATQRNLETIQRNLEGTQTNLEAKLEAAEAKQEAALAKLGATQRNLQALQRKLGATQKRLQTAETKLESAETKLEAAETKLEAAETKLEAAETKLEAAETKLEAAEATLDATGTELQSTKDLIRAKMKGSTFVRWGRKTCTNASELVYSGVAGGGSYDHTGAAANTLCLTMTPQTEPMTRPSYYTHLYGAEYEHIQNHHDQDVPCSVCHATQSATIMIPATRSCPAGWTTQYTGHLVAGHHTHKAATEYVCLDGDPENMPGGHNSHNGHLFYYTYTVCGSLPCPPYTNNVVVLCVVCSK